MITFQEISAIIRILLAQEKMGKKDPAYARAMRDISEALVILAGEKKL